MNHIQIESEQETPRIREGVSEASAKPMSLPSTGAAPPGDLPTVRPSPPHGPLLSMDLPSYVPPHHMDHLTANGLLTAKAIEELCFLDSL